MQFSEVLGQAESKKQLIHWAQSNRLAHAILIEGKSGYGTLPLTLAYAQYLMCENPSETDSCGVCSQCIKTSTLQHPDLHISFPVVSKKGPSTSKDFMPEFLEFMKAHPYGDFNDWIAHIGADKKQGNINADECRNIINGLSLKTMENPLKIQIVWLPEYLGKEGNILLKLLEEPTPNTILMFVTEDRSRLLPTIQSRLQSTTIPPIDSDTLTLKLQSSNNLDQQKINELIALSHGDFREIGRLIQNTDLDYLQLLKLWLNAIFTRNIDLQEEWVQTLSRFSKNEIKQTLQYVTDLLNRYLNVRYSDSSQVILSEDEKKIVQVFSQKEINHSQIIRWVDIINEGLYSMQRNVQPSLALHAMTIQLQYLVMGFEITF